MTTIRGTPSEASGRHPIERLWREVGLPEYFLGNDGSNTKLYALYDAIQSRATAAEATVTALQEALEPFANSDMAPDTYDDDSFVAGSCDFTCGDVRRARAALSQIRSEK